MKPEAQASVCLFLYPFFLIFFFFCIKCRRNLFFASSSFERIFWMNYNA
jgi:hypothetical protein